MTLKIGDLVEINHTALLSDEEPQNLKGGFGILVKDLSISKKPHKALWLIYVQDLGREMLFRRTEFRKVK